MEHISIHALREEGDGAPHPAGARTQHFYPRPPRGGRRSRNSSFGKSKVFLSTPSARRATYARRRRADGYVISIHALREEGDRPGRIRHGPAGCISIHALREEGDTRCKSWQQHAAISIHALREEGDLGLFDGLFPRREFLSTPSARRATGAAGRQQGQRRISIHALREEGDG